MVGWLGLTWLGLAWLGLAWLGLAWLACLLAWLVGWLVGWLLVRLLVCFGQSGVALLVLSWTCLVLAAIMSLGILESCLLNAFNAVQGCNTFPGS